MSKYKRPIWWAIGIGIILFWVSVLVAIGKCQDQDPLHQKTRNHYFIPFKVTRVLDGDTVEGVIEIKVQVRMRNCWAPELKPRHKGRTEESLASEKAAAKASRDHLQKMALNKDGYLVLSFDKTKHIGEMFSFGRLLGSVFIKGEAGSLATRQVAAGHATEERAK